MSSRVETSRAGHSHDRSRNRTSPQSSLPDPQASPPERKQVSEASCSARVHRRLPLPPTVQSGPFDNPPLPKGRRFLPDSESPSVGSCCWPHSSRAHFTGDPGLAGPWVLDRLGVPEQELGCRSCKDSLALSIRSLHPRPEGRGFPRITGKSNSPDVQSSRC
jgi:hypothetical protein